MGRGRCPLSELQACGKSLDRLVEAGSYRGGNDGKQDRGQEGLRTEGHGDGDRRLGSGRLEVDCDVTIELLRVDLHHHSTSGHMGDTGRIPRIVLAPYRGDEPVADQISELVEGSRIDPVDATDLCPRLGALECLPNMFGRGRRNRHVDKGLAQHSATLNVSALGNRTIDTSQADPGAGLGVPGRRMFALWERLQV